jgi:hypothetical protein
MSSTDENCLRHMAKRHGLYLVMFRCRIHRVRECQTFTLANENNYNLVGERMAFGEAKHSLKGSN